MTQPSPFAVIDAGFTPVDLLSRWQADLDGRGLRATGSPAHLDYVADLETRLRSIAPDTWVEEVPHRAWTPRCWSLDVDGPVPVVSPVAYSGRTSAQGVRAPLSSVPAAGTIGVVDIPLSALTAGVFDSLDYDVSQVRQAADHDPETPYHRVWLSQDAMREALAAQVAAGALGCLLVVDLPAAAITGGYLLYDGEERGLPALFVAREQGERLREAAAAGQSATLTLTAESTDVMTPNLAAIIPGQSEELVVLQSHTDGSNGLEDNGPEAILAMTHYLAGLPVGELPRSVLVLLTTGHFAAHRAWGLEAFLARHEHDLVPRIAAALSLEHLGARTWEHDETGGTEAPEHEFGCVFASPHREVVEASRRALDRAAVTESRVLRPFVADRSGRSPDGTSWPGDGTPFWHWSGLPSANFITGPGYLLNVEPVLHLIDVEAMRRQAIAFTLAALELGQIDWDALRTRRTS